MSNFEYYKKEFGSLVKDGEEYAFSLDPYSDPSDLTNTTLMVHALKSKGRVIYKITWNISDLFQSFKIEKVKK